MKSLLGTLIFLCGFGYEHGSHAANILVYSPSYSQSHLITNALMADILAEEAGHNVVMFIPEYHETNFNGTKHAKIIRMSGISDSFDENMKDFSAGFIKDHTLSFRLRKLFEEATSEQCEAILRRKSELEQLRSYNFDVAFSEQLDLCGVGIIRYLGIKSHIWISSGSMMDGLSDTLGVPMPISYVPSVEENDLSTEMSFMERAQNMYL
ncbi:unnamed protein product [Anisakis simplex]|uniref:glucuronosyltransferase n=1 Tax=Anisakis simplex TaxID=6269 RepID=A0A0M3J4V5_ANISI|nr:unnamed protein product [Anisakis simplex]